MIPPIRNSRLGPAIATALAVIFIGGCGPKIYNFDVAQSSICEGDSIKVTWDMRGTPTMLINFVEDSSQTGNKPKTVWLTLVGGDNDDVRRKEIMVYPQHGLDSVAFITSLQSDTLIASGTKDPDRWGDRFEILTVASGSGRPLSVRHAGRSVELDAGGTPSTGLEGTPYEGDWDLRSIITSAERQQPATTPNWLIVRATIQCKRR
jgi:hypothetical protein